jgi:hypothetical protein
MIDYLWLVFGLLLVGLFTYRGRLVWMDAGRWGFEPPHRLLWALKGIVFPASYWWGARIEVMPSREQQELLAEETAALSLSRVDAERCPLCQAEVPRAWTLSAGGKPTVALGPVECPRCDFRLDTCRHCAHFLPGAPRGWGYSAWERADMTAGRCSRYRAWQPVEQATTPDMARQMRDRGYDRIRAPMTIIDSFLPPDSCNAFQPSRQRLREGGVRWPDTHRTALLRLLAARPVPRKTTSQGLPSDDEKWLL